MIWEIAELKIIESATQEFEAALVHAVPLFRRARGCHGMQVRRSIEQPGRYRLIVEWDSVEDHMIHFRQSADFQKWRELVGRFFAAAPEVEHAERLDLGF
jgi:quinol monooxygenase YgiN